MNERKSSEFLLQEDSRAFKEGVNQAKKGKYKRALKNIEFSRTAATKFDMPVKVAKCVFTIGNVYRGLNEFEDALAKYERARGVLEEHEKPVQGAQCLTSIVQRPAPGARRRALRGELFSSGFLLLAPCSLLPFSARGLHPHALVITLLRLGTPRSGR